MTLRLTTLPVSTNQLYRVFRNRSILSAPARANKEAIAWEARSQYRGKPLDGPLRVSVDLHWPDRRQHDIDNLKALFDALTGILWQDDGQIIDLHTRKFYDKAEPRVAMTVEGAGDARELVEASARGPKASKRTARRRAALCAQSKPSEGEKGRR